MVLLLTIPTGITGTDSFDYTISDGNGGTDTATVTLNIDNALQPPTIDLNGNDSGTATVTENFETNNYSGGTGWTSPWQEVGDDNAPGTGSISIVSINGTQALQFNNSGSDSLTRTADLSGYSNAELSFDFARVGLDDVNDYVAVEISTDGNNFTEVYRMAGAANDGTAQFSGSIDISQYISETTQIRFVSNNLDASDTVFVDEININLSNPTDYNTTFTTGGVPVAIASLDTVATDSDSANLSGATITLTNAIAGDTLLVDGALPNGISATVNGTGDVITLSGDASRADYQTAIEALAFDSTNADPTSRIIEVQVTDDTGLTSNVAQSTIDINVDLDNIAPTIDLNGGDAGRDYSNSYIGTPVAIADTDATGSDLDGIDIESLTIDISGTTDTTNELLIFNDASGNTSINLGSNSSKTVTIQGTSYTIDVTNNGTSINIVPTAGGDITSTQVEQLLRSITYLNNAGEPQTGDRTFEFVLNDGQSDSNLATSTISIPVNTPPNIDLDLDDSSTATGNDYQASYISGTPVVISGGDVTITDATDVNIENATITLTNRPDGNGVESLSVNGTLPGGITTTGYDADTGIITLEGSASLADYQQAIKQIRYDNTALTSADERVITVQVNDGELDSLTPIATTRITPFIPPTIDRDYETTFTEDRDPVAISNPNTSISDNDSTNLVRATITLTNRPDGDNIESLFVDGTLPGGITTTGYDSATGTIVLEGSASLADYQTAIELIKYDNDNLTDLSDRTVEVVVSDGSFDSNVAITTIAMNTPPTVDLNGGEDGLNFDATFSLGGNPVAIADTDTLVTDDTDTNIESAFVTLTNFQTGDVLFVNGTDALTGGTFTTSGGNDITYSAVINSGELIVSLTSTVADSVPLADYQELIEAITFDNTQANPDTSDRIIQVTVNDGDSDSDIAISAIAIDTPPIIDLNSTANPADGDRNYSDTFTEGDPVIAVVNAANADIFDAKDDITSLEITLGGVSDDLAVETITIADQTVTLDSNQTITGVTVGGSTVDLAYDAATGTFTVTNNAGATTPIAQADLDTLLSGYYL